MCSSNVLETGVKIGDSVRWESWCGTIRGEVKNIRLDRNAAGELIPWIMIEYHRSMDTSTVELCGSQDYLSMLKFRVNVRDQE